MKTQAQSIILGELQRNSLSQILHWDGRLDNRDDLMLGSGRASIGDDELALAAYQRWGSDGLVRLIGDWSAVIRDGAKGTMILASDYAGVRPLYYCQRADRVYSSSSLQAVVDATQSRELDEHYVAGMLLSGGCPNRTPYKGVYSVPPGHSVCISAGGTSIRAFWTPPTGDLVRFADQHRYDERFAALFCEAVAVRLPRNGTVLAELSGGLDSSSIVSMAHRLMQGGEKKSARLATVSYVWPNSLDLPFIREMESHCKIDGFHISTGQNPLLKEAHVGGAMPEMLGPLRESVLDVAEKIDAKTFLTGMNGDLASGNWFNDSIQIAPHLRSLRIGRAFEDALAWSKILRVPVYTILWRGFQAALPAAMSPTDIYAIPDGSHTPRNQETSLAPAFASRTAEETRELFSNGWMQARPERRKYFRALELMRELRSLQRPEAFGQIDYTHPFAHRPLVEFMMTVPPEVLCGPGEPRRLMRRAVSDLWPQKLRERRSKGLFEVPWQESLRPLVSDLLRARELHVVERGFVDRASLQARLERAYAGLDCNHAQLRQIVLLELWLRQREQKFGAEYEPRVCIADRFRDDCSKRQREEVKS